VEIFNSDDLSASATIVVPPMAAVLFKHVPQA